ncbi:MAG: hypothetical protein N2508_13880, partial [Anaerolineae bacterium]|nr:hypothetical protein [Anaerolineae bacterium]
MDVNDNLAQKGVGVVRVGEVALCRQHLAVGIIAVGVGGLALVFGQPRHTLPLVQMNPVGLARRPIREAAHLKQHRRRAEGFYSAPVELRPLPVPQGVFYRRVQVCLLYTS